MTLSKDQVAYLRRVERADAFQRKGGKCDLCGNHATDMHELYARSVTRGNTLARVLSFKKELCAILCRECHGKAANAHIRNMLLLKNCEIYKRGMVRSAYLKLQAVMKTNLPPFPKNDEVYEL